MIVIVSKLSGVIYRRVAKPLLFRVSPDKVHEQMIVFGAKVQKSRFLRWLLRISWNYQNPHVLSQIINGVCYQNPLGLSAGLDKNFEIAGIVNAIGFGQIEGGSISLRASCGNDKPWFYRLPRSKSIVVNAGLANQGAAKILSRIAKYPPKQIGNMVTNISVAKTNNRRATTINETIDDYLGALKMIKDRSVGDVVTINISCPNLCDGEPFASPANLDKLLAKVDKLNLNKPIFIKMPIDKTSREFTKLLDVIVKHDIQGVTIANLFKDRSQVKLSDELPDEIPGNLSGRPTFEKSNQLIAMTYRRYGDRLTIGGVGGVFDANDAYAKIRAGASLVEMITGLMFEGPQIVGQINRGLAKLLQRDGFEHVSQAVGIDAKKIK